MKSKPSPREKYLLKKYGITEKQYHDLLKKQGGVCAVCGKSPKEGKNLSVDHNHVTGEVRGLLDTYCNRYLVGRHRDPALLIKIADYISQGTGWFVPKKVKKKKRKKKCRTV